MTEGFIMEQASPKRRFAIKIALLFLCLDTMAGNAVLQPVMGSINQAFPDASPTLINMVMTLQNIFMIPASIVAGKLAERINKKTLTLFAFVLYGVIGFCPAFTDNIYLILVFRALTGVGAGFLFPLSQAMVADAFRGNERAQILGFAPAAGALMGSGIGILSGYLASSDWHYAFFSYAVLLICPVVVIFVLPKDLFAPKKTGKQKRDGNGRISLGSIPLAVYLLALTNLVSGVCMFLYMMRLAILIMDLKIGGGGPEVAGVVMSFTMVGALASGVVFAFLYKHTKYFTIVIGWGSMALAGFLWWQVPNLVTCCVSVALVAVSSGLSGPLINMVSLKITPPEKHTMAMAITQIGTQAASFLATFGTAIILFFLPNSTTQEHYVVPATFMLIFTIGAFIFAFKHRHSEMDPMPRMGPPDGDDQDNEAHEGAEEREGQ